MIHPDVPPWVGWYGWVRILIASEMLEPGDSPVGLLMDRGAGAQLPFPTKTYPEIGQYELVFPIMRNPPISVHDMTLPHLNRWSGFFAARPRRRDLSQMLLRLQDAPTCRWCCVLGASRWVQQIPASLLARRLVAVVPLTSGREGESLYLFRVGPQGGRTAQLDMSVQNSSPERLREFWRASPDHVA